MPTGTGLPASGCQLFHPIVRRFLRDGHVVHVALAGAGGCDANQLRAPLELGNGGTAAVAHAGAQTPDELVNHGRDAALVRDAAFDALGDELVGRAATFEIELVLKVPIAAAAAHGADRSHAAVLLVTPALEQDQLAGTLVGAGEEIPDHGAARAHRQRLHDVT